MTLDRFKHSAILSTLLKMADDVELIGAHEFIKGKWKYNQRQLCGTLNVQFLYPS